MFQIGKTLVSEELFSEQFHCNLEACKGACCVEGDSGAPLLEHEAKILNEILPKIKPFLSETGWQAIEEQGSSVVDRDGDLVTPLNQGAECAYVVFENGKALCGIEKAWKAGVIDFQKPVSCHLYPIRIGEYVSFDAVNYNRWEICSPACELGKALKMPVFRFVREALIRRYGLPWFQELESTYEYWLRSREL